MFLSDAPGEGWLITIKEQVVGNNKQLQQQQNIKIYCYTPQFVLNNFQQICGRIQ